MSVFHKTTPLNPDAVAVLVVAVFDPVRQRGHRSTIATAQTAGQRLRSQMRMFGCMANKYGRICGIIVNITERLWQRALQSPSTHDQCVIYTLELIPLLHHSQADKCCVRTAEPHL